MKYLEILYFCVSLVLINIMGISLSLGLDDPFIGFATIVISVGLILILKAITEYEQGVKR